MVMVYLYLWFNRSMELPVLITHFTHRQTSHIVRNMRGNSNDDLGNGF